MNSFDSENRHQRERAIIDSLLKISEIIRKTENSRKHQVTVKQAAGDGNTIDGQITLPSPTRALNSYVAESNHSAIIQQPSNCNRAAHNRSKHRSPRDDQDQEISVKRNRMRTVWSDDEQPSNCSSSNCDHQYTSMSKVEQLTTKKSCNSEATIIQTNSTVTVNPDNQLHSLTMVPIVSATAGTPTMNIGQSSDQSEGRKIQMETELDAFIDQHLKKTLENRFRTNSSVWNSKKIIHIDQHKQVDLVETIQTQTKKLINSTDSREIIVNNKNYEKQRQRAMLEAKQGNYATSYEIYTNLLREQQYDCQRKSEILASRATTLLLEDKCFESIDDCTQAIALNQWNKLAYIVRAASWMIKQEYGRAVDDYSKLFYFFDQSRNVLDLLNLAYEKFKAATDRSISDQSDIELTNSSNQLQVKSVNENIRHSEDHRAENLSLALTSPVASSFVQPAIYFCYPYQNGTTWRSSVDKQAEIFDSNHSYEISIENLSSTEN